MTAYAKLSLDNEIIKQLWEVVGKNLTKKKNPYYFKMYCKWKQTPILVTENGIKVPCENVSYRTFLAGCIREATSFAWSQDYWHAHETTYNKKLRSILYFEEHGTFTIPRNRSVIAVNSKLEHSRALSKIRRNNKARLSYLPSLFRDEIFIQICILQAIYSDLNLSTLNEDIDVKFSFANNRQRSKGGIFKGIPTISFALSPLLLFEKNQTTNYYEYDSFSDDPNIGTVRDCSLNTFIALLVAHELAHVVQFLAFSAFKKGNWGTQFEESDFKEHHGLVWKTIYKALRIELGQLKRL